jgi:hypothetical protein
MVLFESLMIRMNNPKSPFGKQEFFDSIFQITPLLEKGVPPARAVGYLILSILISTPNNAGSRNHAEAIVAAHKC